MRPMRTRVTLRTRLERLESSVREQHRLKVRFGNLKRLPREYEGERHIIISSHLPNQDAQELVEFEEVPGPDPNPFTGHRGVPGYIDIVLVDPYPAEAEAA